MNIFNAWMIFYIESKKKLMGFLAVINYNDKESLSLWTQPYSDMLAVQKDSHSPGLQKFVCRICISVL